MSRRRRTLPLAFCLLACLAQGRESPGDGGPGDSAEPPVIPIGTDAFLQWDRWPYLRIGVRAYMRSTFDRTGGNYFADAAHYLRMLDDERSVALDEAGPGIL
jgi:hypothetical protein